MSIRELPIEDFGTGWKEYPACWPSNTGDDWRALTYKNTLPTTDGEQLRHLLQLWVELDQRRHPEFQAKELLEQSKEAINNSRI